MTKVHRITVIVVDTDGLGLDNVRRTIEAARYPNRCIHPTCVAGESVDVEWSDDHPLNKTDARVVCEAVKMLFDGSDA